jgi:hypothetical protein
MRGDAAAADAEAAAWHPRSPEPHDLSDDSDYAAAASVSSSIHAVRARPLPPLFRSLARLESTLAAIRARLLPLPAQSRAAINPSAIRVRRQRIARLGRWLRSGGRICWPPFRCWF